MRESTRVLIVDDVRDNREAYAEYLRFKGFTVTEAATGADAIRHVARLNEPQTVLLDMRLPDMDGEEVSRRLRRMRGSNLTIIAVSACTAEDDVTRALESGCDTFLSKPCLPETLEMEIRRRAVGTGSRG